MPHLRTGTYVKKILTGIKFCLKGHYNEIFEH